MARYSNIEETVIESLENAAERIERIAQRLHAAADLPDDIGP
jgi:hypothetical protein